MLNKSILIGYSGHGYVVAETALENNVKLIGYSEIRCLEKNPFNLDYLGFEKGDDFIGWKENVSFILGVGNNVIRQKVANLVEINGKELRTLTHNTASLSKYSKIGSGTFINKNVVINTLANIGKYVILNTGCIVEHECVISDGVHVAPGAVLLGNVCIGERTFIGANAVIKQGLVIGSDVIIGAGAVVLTNIPDGTTVAGNPGKKI